MKRALAFLLVPAFLLLGCRQVKSFLWRQTHQGHYHEHTTRSVRRDPALPRKQWRGLGTAFRPPKPPAVPAKPARHRKH